MSEDCIGRWFRHCGQKAHLAIDARPLGLIERQIGVVLVIMRCGKRFRTDELSSANEPPERACGSCLPKAIRRLRGE